MRDSPLETLKQFMRAGIIINNWAPEFRQKFGEGILPDDYFTYDVETSGFSPKNDLIIEWGHCLVIDRKVVNKGSFLINWYKSPHVPASYIDSQLERLAQAMRVQNRTWRITPQLLKEKGISPDRFVTWMFDYLTCIKEQKLMFVAHNYDFDNRMIKACIEQDLGKVFDFGTDRVFDTGAVEKASQLSDEIKAMPKPGESPFEYFKRIRYCRAPGVEWNLDDHCMKKYNLAQKYGLDPAKSHQAGEDAFALHCLVEEFRELATAAANSQQAQGLDPAAFRQEYLKQPIAKQRPEGKVRDPMPWEPAKTASPTAVATAPKPQMPVQNFRGQRRR